MDASVGSGGPPTAKHAMLLPDSANENANESANVVASTNATTEDPPHAALHAALRRCKDAIAQHTSWRWEAAKRTTNDYELVYSWRARTSTFFGRGSHGVVGRAAPVSRSYFKMWEVLGDYAHEMLPPPHPSSSSSSSSSSCGGPAGRAVTAAFLAEAPGGFIESFLDHRRVAGGIWTSVEGAHETDDGPLGCTKPPPQSQDRLHCITLVSPRDARVPTLQMSVLSRAASRIGARIQLHAGQDGTGDLLQRRNIDHFVAEVGGDRCCDLVTADGGFDFSGDFNAQEVDMLPLLLSEAHCALRLLRTGGCLLLKMFDVSDGDTLALLWALRRSFERVRLLKPLTSRAANSEKYVLCTGRRDVEQCLQARDAETQVAEAQAAGGQEGARLLPRAPRWFADAVLEFTAHRVVCQIANIAATLAAAAVPISSALPAPAQVDKALAWCRRYAVPVNDHAIRLSSPKNSWW